MTKLEWCRLNAPEALRNESDEFILEAMSAAYDMMVGEENVDSSVYTLDTDRKLDVTNNYLDVLVSALVREFGTDLVFKGGYMMTKLLPGAARQTTDIDCSIQEHGLYEKIIVRLQVVCEKFKEKGIIDNYEIKNELRRTMSGGCKMYKNGNVILGVDVGWHNVTYGTVIQSINIGDVNSFTVERMLADKIIAILSRKRFRRPKDLYDLFCISEYLTFNARKVNEYIIERTDGQGAEWKNIPFSIEVLNEYSKAYSRLSLVSIYKDVSGNPIKLRKPEFNLVLDRFYEIADVVRDAQHVNTIIWSIKGHYFVEGD